MISLLAAARSTQRIAHHRDNETGAHLDRMAHYSRLIARELADRYALDDAYIEHVFLFAPLHDIGKVAIPDRILQKPGALNDSERVTMQTHARRGREIVDDVIGSFGLNSLEHVHMMRNIVEYHHESLNGEGYPCGLEGDDIPLEARIVAVADVFDALTSAALTSARPYKQAWSNDAAFDFLRSAADHRFDRGCVDSLIKRREEVERIQATFGENSLG